MLQPPPTKIFWPVTNVDASLNKRTRAPVRSSDSAILFPLTVFFWNTVLQKILVHYYGPRQVIDNIASIYGFLAPGFELYENASFRSPIEVSAIMAVY